MRVLQRRWQCEGETVEEILTVAIDCKVPIDLYYSSPEGYKSEADRAFESWSKEPWWSWLVQNMIGDPKVETVTETSNWNTVCYLRFEIRSEEYTYWMMRWGQ